MCEYTGLRVCVCVYTYDKDIEKQLHGFVGAKLTLLPHNREINFPASYFGEVSFPVSLVSEITKRKLYGSLSCVYANVLYIA